MQLAVPSRLTAEQVRFIMRKEAPRVIRQAAEVQLKAPSQRFVTSEMLPYLGRNVRLIVKYGEVSTPEFRFDRSRFRLVVPRNLKRKERYGPVHGTIAAWYQAKAQERMPASVERWWSKLGRGKISRVLICDHQRHWGSCGSDGTLHFNWRVMRLEPALVDFCVVHELAHLSPNPPKDTDGRREDRGRG